MVSGASEIRFAELDRLDLGRPVQDDAVGPGRAGAELERALPGSGRQRFHGAGSLGTRKSPDTEIVALTGGLRLDRKGESSTSGRLASRAVDIHQNTSWCSGGMCTV